MGKMLCNFVDLRLEFLLSSPSCPAPGLRPGVVCRKSSTDVSKVFDILVFLVGLFCDHFFVSLMKDCVGLIGLESSGVISELVFVGDLLIWSDLYESCVLSFL